jgi:hypothetical protein
MVTNVNLVWETQLHKPTIQAWFLPTIYDIINADMYSI